MNLEKITAWVTTDALTTGIKRVMGEVDHNADSGKLTCPAEVWFRCNYGNNWHRTPEAAIARAEEMRKNKIISLRESIENLEALKFTAPNVEFSGGASQPSAGTAGYASDDKGEANGKSTDR